MFLKLSVLALAGVLAAPVALGTIPQKRVAAFFNPSDGGGSMLANSNNGFGEPLNVIISGLSDSRVLTDVDHLVNYARAIGFSEECFGIHLGDPFAANLGDGNGPVNQTIELRQDYGDADVGTCLESLIGGNHFRVYSQNGPTADSGAIFLAVSREESISNGHTIVADGYNIGRNELVEGALGTTSFNGLTYFTTAQNITGLLPAGSQGVNHDIATDGVTTVLTVTIQ